MIYCPGDKSLVLHGPVFGLSWESLIEASQEPIQNPIVCLRVALTVTFLAPLHSIEARKLKHHYEIMLFVLSLLVIPTLVRGFLIIITA